MGKQLFTALLALAFSAGPVWADKPEWAGEGGKPSAQQVEEHRDEMRAKNNDKAGPKGQQGNIDQQESNDKQYQKEKQKKKEKQKQKSKEKTEQSGDDHEQSRDRDKDRDQDQDRDHDQHQQKGKTS